jgi:hypothetical protein
MPNAGVPSYVGQGCGQINGTGPFGSIKPHIALEYQCSYQSPARSTSMENSQTHANTAFLNFSAHIAASARLHAVSAYAFNGLTVGVPEPLLISAAAAFAIHCLFFKGFLTLLPADSRTDPYFGEFTITVWYFEAILVLYQPFIYNFGYYFKGLLMSHSGFILYF